WVFACSGVTDLDPGTWNVARPPDFGRSGGAFPSGPHSGTWAKQVARVRRGKPLLVAYVFSGV
ncbi:MAG: hypothetical protein ABJA82_05015, partial [Myxococcales bacterium]